MTADGSVNASKVRVFHTSEPFVDYVWAARMDVSEAQKEKFARAFLDLKAGENDSILEILRGKSFVRVKDSEYDAVRSVARELKML
jgi:phosphonate transport system substrate-binding protein